MNIESVASSNNQSKNARTSSLRSQKWLLLFSIAILSLSMGSGCVSPRTQLFDGSMIDGVFSNYRDKVWAKRACNLRYANCNRPYPEHFQSGFEAGYINICEGGDGYVPATPPESYWGFEYQTPDGSQCVKSWFEGYPAGVEAAKRDRAGTYRDVYVSRMIQSAIAQDKTPKTTPTRVAVVDSQNVRRGSGLVEPTPMLSPQQQPEQLANPTTSYDPSIQVPPIVKTSIAPASYGYER